MPGVRCAVVSLHRIFSARRSTFLSLFSSLLSGRLWLIPHSVLRVPRRYTDLALLGFSLVLFIHLQTS